MDKVIKYSDFIMKKLLGALLLISMLFTSSCLFGPSTKRVMSYRYNNVFLSGRDHFQVGGLPPTWDRFRVKAYAIAFHNEVLGSTISVDAFCGPAYEDAPLATLTSQLFAGVENYEVTSSDEFMLDERGALRTISTGRVDGVSLTYDTVVIKKNKCIIDFMLISPDSNYFEAKNDFENFFYAFHYE